MKDIVVITLEDIQRVVKEVVDNTNFSSDTVTKLVYKELNKKQILDKIHTAVDSILFDVADSIVMNLSTKELLDKQRKNR